MQSIAALIIAEALVQEPAKRAHSSRPGVLARVPRSIARALRSSGSHEQAPAWLEGVVPSLDGYPSSR